MKIGIDIDGVIVDTINFCSREITKHLGYNVTCEDIIWRFSEIPGLQDFWNEKEEYFLCSLKPVEGVVAHVHELRKQHELFFISSRFETVLEATRGWFIKYGLPPENINFTSGKSKFNICKNLGIELFIDDFAHNVAEISELGIKVILLEAEYNKDYKNDSVIRCRNWEEIMENIRVIQEKKGIC